MQEGGEDMICEYRSKIYKLETAGNCILHKNSVQLQEKIFLAKDVNYIVPTSGSVLYQKCTKTRQCAENIYEGLHFILATYFLNFDATKAHGSHRWIIMLEKCGHPDFTSNE